MRGTGFLPAGFGPGKLVIVLPFLALPLLAGCGAGPGLGGASDAINAPVCQEQSEMAAQGVVGDGTMTITCP